MTIPRDSPLSRCIEIITRFEQFRRGGPSDDHGLRDPDLVDQIQSLIQHLGAIPA